MNFVIPFQHQDIHIKEAYWIYGRPYFTQRAIGGWLEYDHPQDAISKIVTRNPHIKEFSVVAKLATTDGKKYEHECYDPIGLQLIVMESNKRKAIEYKIAVAHLVTAYASGQLIPAPRIPKEIAGARESLLALDTLPKGPRMKKAIEIGKALGKSPQTIYRWRQKLKTTGTFFPKTPDRSKHRLPIWKEIWRLADTGMKKKAIAKQCGVGVRTVSRVLKKRPIHF